LEFVNKGRMIDGIWLKWDGAAWVEAEPNPSENARARGLGKGRVYRQEQQ
jgi:hypothetical protein